MSEDLASYIIVPEEVVLTDSPHLHLVLSAGRELSLTLPYSIQFSITRQDGPDAKPVIFEWSSEIHGFTESGFVLLHHTATGLEPMAIDHSGLVDISRKGSLMVNGYNISELASNDSDKFLVTLPERYQKLLKSDEDYTLLWPGGTIATWDWGTVREHVGQEVVDKENPLILPGGPHVSFTARAESIPWPMRAEREARVGFSRANFEERRWRQSQALSKAFPPQVKLERDPEAPRLSVNLECSPTLHQNVQFEVKTKVTYQAEAAARPIIFHTLKFGYDYYQLGRLNNGNWEIYDDSEGGTGFRIVDDPDVPVNVSQHEDFVSLRPGESWTTSLRIQEDWVEIPRDAYDGEHFRCIFRGATLDWWNWGTKEEHAETVVKVPCWITGPVVDPKHNDGRPKLVVPASNVVEFSVKK